MSRLKGILETSLYTDDMDRARAFYEGVLGLQPMFSDDSLTAYAIERSVLLLFREGTTSSRTAVFRDTAARANCTSHSQLKGRSLKAGEIASRTIEGENGWSRGGHSVYFRDPDGNLLELVTPGLWAVY
jgi:catechol 2,3-dioxygenase-like lactoylglutathione lyase family enzyme